MATAKANNAVGCLVVIVAALTVGALLGMQAMRPR